MSYGSAYPCSRAVLSASLHIELPPCGLPAAGAAWPRHRSYVLAREDHAHYLSGWAGCARGERNDNIRKAPAIVLHNDAICLTREQRLSGDKLNGAHGIIHCKGARDWHLFGIALPRMFVTTIVCVIVSKTVIFKIGTNASCICRIHNDNVELILENSACPWSHSTFIVLVLRFSTV